ncbi:MAG TPA: NAD(P)/FAD-dependent oxidoreductase [Burkholderiaceae bacterium]|nr:NAD(P)/FAD-dependent oxidoreductase [Burkholderiaceae bacterium]
MQTDELASPVETDALVIGAGPVGLYLVFQLGLQGIRAHVLDTLRHAGGQPVELYGDKPIYDIPGLPACTGQELADRLLQQVAPFQPAFHFGQLVAAIERLADNWFVVSTDKGLTFRTRSVFIAAGVGAFLPKKLALAELAPFEDTQVLYHPPEALDVTGQHIVIAGGDQAALEWAIQLAERPAARAARSITLLHRRDVLQVDEHTLARWHELLREGLVSFVVGQIKGVLQSDGPHRTMTGLHISHPDGTESNCVADRLVVLQGISPKLGPLSNWGLAMSRKQLTVDTSTFATSQPGIFAIGDIVHYPGKKKLLACGFHEGVLAAFGAAEFLHPERTGPLEYTSSSQRLQQLLGVSGPA